MFKHEIDDAFAVDAPVQKNDSVRDYQYFSYSAADANARTRIELRFDDTSKYFLPCEAFIEVEGQITGNDNAAYADVAIKSIGFVNNGVMALFSSALYIIGSTRIESIDNDVDVATTIIGLARYSDDFIKSAGHSMMFAKDYTDNPNPHEFELKRPTKYNSNEDADVELLAMTKNQNYNPGFVTRKSMLNNDGRFSCTIPLSHIFGFCRDVRRVIFGNSHTVVLMRRQNDDLALWRSNTVNPGKVK